MTNPNVRYLVLGGPESKGHLTGEAIKALIDNGVDERYTYLIIVGIQTEYCIDTTCRRAYSLGYDVTLVQDAHTTWDTQDLKAPQVIHHHNQVLGGWFANVVPASAIKMINY